MTNIGQLSVYWTVSSLDTSSPLCMEECRPQLNLDIRLKKKGNLDALCLLQIAEHVDATDGFLSKLSLYKALALIAFAQQGKQPSGKLLANCIQGGREKSLSKAVLQCVVLWGHMPSFNWLVYNSNKWNFLWPCAVRVVIIVVKTKQEDISADSYITDFIWFD